MSSSFLIMSSSYLQRNLSQVYPKLCHYPRGGSPGCYYRSLLWHQYLYMLSPQGHDHCVKFVHFYHRCSLLFLFQCYHNQSLILLNISQNFVARPSWVRWLRTSWSCCRCRHRHPSGARQWSMCLDSQRQRTVWGSLTTVHWLKQVRRHVCVCDDDDNDDTPKTTARSEQIDHVTVVTNASKINLCAITKTTASEANSPPTVLFIN